MTGSWMKGKEQVMCLWLSVVVPDTVQQILFAVAFFSVLWVLSHHIIGSA